MLQWALQFVGYGGAALALLLAWGTVQAEPPATPTDAAARAALLVEQLRAADFSQREEATQELIRLGSAALKAVQAGTKHADAEVRFRCRYLLTAIAYQQRWGQLEAFAADLDGERNLNLPGWERFRRRIGESRQARALYAEMYRAESDLIELVEQQPAKAAEQLPARLKEIQLHIQFGRQLSLGNIAGLIFVASHEQVQVPDTVARSLHSYCNQASFRTAIQGGGRQEILRRLLGMWVAADKGDPRSNQALLLAMQYDLPEAIPLAEELASREGAAASFRQYAILALAKLGNAADHADVLEAALDDRTVCATRQLVVEGERIVYQTQIRDLALVALIHLHGEDPLQFGFSNLQANPQILYNPATAGFSDDEQRTAALARWRAFHQNKAAP